MPSICIVILTFGYLSIFVLLKNEEKHMNVLEGKIIRAKRKK